MDAYATRSPRDFELASRGGSSHHEERRDDRRPREPEYPPQRTPEERFRGEDRYREKRTKEGSTRREDAFIGSGDNRGSHGTKSGGKGEGQRSGQGKSWPQGQSTPEGYEGPSASRARREGRSSQLWKKGEEVEAEKLHPGELRDGLMIAIPTASYFLQECRVSGKVQGLEMKGGETHARSSLWAPPASTF